MSITLKPIGFVQNELNKRHKGNWEKTISEIKLVEPFTADSLLGLDSFSHAEILFFFDRVTEDMIQTGSGPPRKNPDWPEVGIFSQRGYTRPNRLGATIVRILAVNGKSVTVKGLDALNGTPVIDIKPLMREFLPPDKDINQPSWADELMKSYWVEKSRE
ncbi:tRNA (N6-threonylcarbamoyladenosine(37)-N6)-methyltransferase TrmO [Chloroflexota bacterium]